MFEDTQYVYKQKKYKSIVKALCFCLELDQKHLLLFQSMLPSTEEIEGFIVRVITDGQVAVTVQLEATFKDLLRSSQ